MAVGITVFDGASTIGGNKIYLEFKNGEFNNKGLFFDFGTNFATYGNYYEEFLIPRPGRGIHDMLTLGLIPNISCYRKDLITSDASLGELKTIDPLAILVSHAHMDHIGNIGLLDGKIPVIASPMTVAIMKAMQDCGGKMEAEASYITKRIPIPDETRLIEATHYRKNPFEGRDICLTCACSNTTEFQTFWDFQPMSRALIPGKIKELSAFPGPEIKAFDVDHSIYGACAYAINSDAGWIVYSGDVRKHGVQADKTKTFVEDAKKLSPKLLIIEGTRVSRKGSGDDKEITEEDVLKQCLDATKNSKNLVIADFSARNFERLDMFRAIAQEAGRKLVITLKDAYILHAMKNVDGIDRLKDICIYKDLKVSREGYEKMIMENYPGKLLDPSDIRKKPEQYICCFSFFDIKNMLDIKTTNGTYIYSSSEAHGEEQKIDFVRLKNWLTKFNFKIKGFHVEIGENKSVTVIPEKNYHASGHASASDILEIINQINPEIVMPIHTEAPDFFKEKISGRELIIPEKGREYVIK